MILIIDRAMAVRRAIFSTSDYPRRSKIRGYTVQEPQLLYSVQCTDRHRILKLKKRKFVKLSIGLI
jgi:hypothetical protein